LITAISDQDGDGKLETSDIADGTTAFRNQIRVAEGRAKIAAAQAKLASLQTHLEALKPIISNATLTDADKTSATKVIDNVIVKGYTALEDEADKLYAALKALEANPTAENVTKARDQWRATRSPWEYSSQ
jgi:predicted lipoprotein